MTESTDPGGKTREELDEEEETELEELRAQLGPLEASNRALLEREVDLTAKLLALRAVKTVRPTPFAAIFMLVILAVTIAVHVSVRRSIVEHLADLTPPAAECPAVNPGPEPPAIPSATAAPIGYWRHGLDGESILVPWPDPNGYPEDRFVRDCQAVCETPGGSAMRLAGRVLLVDPGHLTCVCFHEGSTWPIERWIAWERINW